MLVMGKSNPISSPEAGTQALLMPDKKEDSNG